MFTFTRVEAQELKDDRTTAKKCFEMLGPMCFVISLWKVVVLETLREPNEDP